MTTDPNDVRRFCVLCLSGEHTHDPITPEPIATDDPIANLRKWEAIIADLPPREHLVFHCGTAVWHRLSQRAELAIGTQPGVNEDRMLGLPVIVEDPWFNPRAWQVIAHLPGGDEIRYQGELKP